jgi:glycosyltransferase 2 family protein
VRELLGRASRSTLVRLAITAAILFYLSTKIDMAAAARGVASISLPHLALVLVLVAIDRSVMILRWILLLRSSGIGISIAQASRLFLVSSFVGSFLPAGVGADAARAYGLAQHTTTGSEALASVAVDRLLGILSLVAMAVVGLIAWGPRGAEDWRIAASVAVLAAATVSVFWADPLVRALVPVEHHGGPLARRLLRATAAVSRYRNHRGALVHVMAWSIVVQLLRVTQAYVLGLGLGLPVPFAYYLLFMPFALLLLLLPISVSGFGLPQGGIIWLLQPYGIPAETSFAFSTLIVLTGLAGNLPGLWLWLSARGEG